jgi:hypothetical protein
MHPDEPAGVLAVRARLAAKARRVGDVGPRQVGRVQDLVAVQIGDRHFGRGDEEEIVGREPVEIVLELGKLPRAGEGDAIHQVGGRDLEVAVLAGMQVEHEAGQRAHQSGSHAPEHRKARAGELRAGGQIEQVQRRGELPVRPGLEVEPRFLAPGTDHPVRAGVAVGNALGGKIRQRERAPVELGLDVAQPRIERLHLVARGLQPRHQLVGGLAGPLAAGHVLTRRVALGLERLDSHEQLAPLAVELQQRVHRLGHRRIAATEQAGATALRILAQALEVDHMLVSGPGGRARGRDSRSWCWPEP